MAAERPRHGSRLARSKSRAVRIQMVGLTIRETKEFRAIEKLLPFDDEGNVAWTFEGEPTTEQEKRWLELHTKHQAALTNTDAGSTQTSASSRQTKTH